MASNMARVDEHVITLAEYDEIPELTGEEGTIVGAIEIEAPKGGEKDDDEAEGINRFTEGAPRDDYPWAQSNDERRRAYVFEFMANADLDIKILIGNMGVAE